MAFEWLGSPEFIGAGFGLTALNSIGTNIFNYGQQREAFDYQKALNERIMEREDTAIQRRMADAAAAGVNPYAVVGSGAGAGGNVSAPGAPQMKSGVIDALNTGLDAYARIVQTKKAQAEMENVEKTGLLLDADLAGKLDSNKILGLEVADKILETQKNIAGFNFDFGQGFFLDDNNKLKNLQDILNVKDNTYLYGSRFRDSNFFKGKNSDLAYKTFLANLTGENWQARATENRTLADILQEELAYKINQNTYYDTPFQIDLLSKGIDAQRLKNEQEKTLYAGIALQSQLDNDHVNRLLKGKENEWYNANQVVNFLKKVGGYTEGSYNSGISLLTFLLSLLQ